MALFGSWLDNLFGKSQQSPAMPAPVPVVPAQAAPADPFAALIAERAKSAQDPAWWQKAAGILGGGLQDFAAAHYGRPEMGNGISNYFGGIKQRQDAALASAAQGNVLNSLSGADPSKPLPADLPLQLAKLKALGVDTGPLDTYMSARQAMMPKYTRDDSGNIWSEAPGQPPQLIQQGPGKPTTVGPGQSIAAINPYGGGAPAPAAAGSDMFGGAVDPAAVATIESRNNPAAVSPAGATGTMQTMPGTLQSPGYGVAPAANNSPQEQTRVGQDYVKAMTAKYGPAIGLVAYNMGPGATDKWLAAGGDFSKLPEETQKYVGRAAVTQAMQARGAAPANAGGKVLFQAAPEYRAPTPEELKQYPGASQINAATGEAKYPPAAAVQMNQPQDTSTIDYWAHSVAAGGPMPTLGMGAQAATMRQAILKRAAAINTEQGLGGADQNVATASTKANSAALSKQTQLRSATEGFENTMLQNMNIARDLLKKGAGTTGVPVLNRWQRYIKGEYGGDPDVIALNNAIDTVADENAKIRSGTLGNTPATDSMRANIKSGLNGAMTPQQIEGAFKVMEQDAGNRTRALRAQEDALRSALKGGSSKPNIPGIQGNAPAQQAQTDIPRVTPAQAAKLPKGTKFMTTDGRVLVRQ